MKMAREDPELAYMQAKHLARHFMSSKGMPSLVINAPEGSDDQWRVYPSGCAAIGTGRTLAEALDQACEHPQVPPMNGPVGDNP